MLKNIYITNFRCFSEIEVNGFRTINLIGGENNSGKTALLEAIFLSSFPDFPIISLLRQFRDEGDSIIKITPERTWDYFFYNFNKDVGIKFYSEYDDNSTSSMALTCLYGVEPALKALADLTDNKEKLSELLSSKFSDTVFLNVEGSDRGNSFNYLYNPDKKDGKIGGFKNLKDFLASPFLHSIKRFQDKSIAKLYTNIKPFRDKFHEILHTIDSRIIGSELEAPWEEPILTLNLNNGMSVPINMFGDAVKKVVEIVLVMLNTQNSMIFIDEIENGIHYKKHHDLWRFLFQIAKDQKLQIFATSHSGEMIRAFSEVTYNSEIENDAMYFEMYKDPRGFIVANPLDTAMLNYAILTNNFIRGER